MLSIFISSGAYAFAYESEETFKVEQEYQEYINEAKGLDLDEMQSMEKLSELNAQLSDDVKELYREELAENINVAMLEGVGMPENKTYHKEEFVLENGEKLIIEMYDEIKSLEDLARGTSSGHDVHFEGYKDYGNMSYTAVIYVNSLVDGKLVLETTNRYTISSKGLNTRTPSHQAYVTSPTIYKTKSSVKVTDSTAYTVGEDINVLGKAEGVVEEGYSVPTGTVYKLEADVRVKLVSLDKTNKRAKVKHHVYAKMSY